MHSLAPIAVFTYKRPNETKIILNAIKNAKYGLESEIFIFCDGLKETATENEKDAQYKLKEIIYKETKEFKKKNIYFNNKNIGLSESIIQGIGKVFQKHDKIIVIEDDIIIGKGFLEFMNWGLNTYWNEPSVWGCNGYIEPIDLDLNKPFFTLKPTSWGWSIKKSAWEKLILSDKQLIKILNEKKLLKRMNVGNYPFSNMLLENIQGKINSWAIRLYASSLIHNGFWISPTKSLVKNCGNKDATHNFDSRFFKDSNFGEFSALKYVSINTTRKIDMAIISFYKNLDLKANFFQRFYKTLKLFLKKIST